MNYLVTETIATHQEKGNCNYHYTFVIVQHLYQPSNKGVSRSLFWLFWRGV